MFLCGLQVVLVVECVSVLLLQLLVLLLNHIKLVCAMVQYTPYLTQLKLVLLHLLEVDTPLLGDHTVLPLQCLVFILHSKHILLLLLL